MKKWQESLCRPSASVSLPNVEDYAGLTTAPGASPIDVFHGTVQELLMAGEPQYLQKHPVLGPLLFAGVVGAVEEYIRSLVGRVLAICAESQILSADKQISLGSAVWHGSAVVARGALEHESFTGTKTIQKVVREFLGWEFPKKSRTMGVLPAYDQICEVRHGVVHSGKTFPGKNAVKLRIPPQKDRTTIQVGFAQVQECAEICTALVVSLNLDLFEVMAKRWATSWRQKAGWKPAESALLFEQVWDIFASDFDLKKNLITSPATDRECHGLVMKEYGLS